MNPLSYHDWMTSFLKAHGRAPSYEETWNAATRAVPDQGRYWRHMAYAQLGHLRDGMDPGDVRAIQNFLGPLHTVTEDASYGASRSVDGARRE